jgi:hypothetical protein
MFQRLYARFRNFVARQLNLVDVEKLPPPKPATFGLQQAEQILKGIEANDIKPSREVLAVVRISNQVIGVEDTFDSEVSDDIGLCANRAESYRATAEHLRQQMEAALRDATAFDSRRDHLRGLAKLFGTAS